MSEHTKEWRREITAEIKELTRERHRIGPIQWRSNTVHSMDQIDYGDYDGASPSTGHDPVGNRNSAWTYITLDYPSRYTWGGVEIGPVMRPWLDMWAYLTKQQWYSVTETYTGRDWCPFTVPTAFSDVFFKVILCAEQGVEHPLLDAIESSTVDFRANATKYSEIGHRRSFTDARDNALAGYLSAHRQLAAAIDGLAE